MDIHSFQPNLSSDLPVRHSPVHKPIRGSSAEPSEASNLESKAGEVVRELTAVAKESSDVRDEMVEKGKRLRDDPNFPSADQWETLARALVRESDPGVTE